MGPYGALLQALYSAKMVSKQNLAERVGVLQWQMGWTEDMSIGKLGLDLKIEEGQMRHLDILVMTDVIDEAPISIPAILVWRVGGMRAINVTCIITDDPRLALGCQHFVGAQYAISKAAQKGKTLSPCLVTMLAVDWPWLQLPRRHQEKQCAHHDVVCCNRSADHIISFVQAVKNKAPGCKVRLRVS